jgi:hypothetical protein
MALTEQAFSLILVNMKNAMQIKRIKGLTVALFSTKAAAEAYLVAVSLPCFPPAVLFPYGSGWAIAARAL